MTITHTTRFYNQPLTLQPLLNLSALVLLIIFNNPAASADFQLGLDAYHEGRYTTAAEEWLPLAEQGDARAQLNLGLMYYNAMSGAQNYQAAAKWLSLAAEQGHANADAYYALALMYSNGWGAHQDYQAGVKWYALAAEQGHADAQYNLGLMYSNGLGAPEDHKAARKWLSLAAQQGHADAQNSLGVMHLNGEGVRKDYVQAYMWFNVAGINGSADATKGLDTVTKKMTSAQIEEAKDLARKWIKNHNK